MVTFDVRDFVQNPAVRVEGEIHAPADARERIKIRPIGDPLKARHLFLSITAQRIVGNIVISLGPGHARFTCDSGGRLSLSASFWGQATLEIGGGTTMNSARIVVSDADVVVGDDNLWSDEILVQSSDQHGIYDLDTMQPLRPARTTTRFGAHVWLGRRAVIMPDVSIGNGSIIGTGSVVTRPVGNFCVAAGVPARTVRENVTWSRSTSGFSAAETQWLEAARSAG